MENIKEKMKDISRDILVDCVKDIIPSAIGSVVTGVLGLVLGVGTTFAWILAVSVLVLILLFIFIRRLPFIKNRKLKSVAARMEAQLSDHIKNKGQSASIDGIFHT